MTEKRRNSRRRLVAGALALALVAAAVAWLVVDRRRDRQRPSASSGQAAAAGPAPREALGGDAMQGMQGMAGMGASDGSVHVTAAQVREFGITFATVEQRTLEAVVRATGAVAIDETRLVRVVPKVGGFAERVYVEATGAPVRAGQPLLELYSPEILAAQEELLLARRLDRTVGEGAVPGVPASTTDLLGAARRRLRLLDVPDAQIAEVLRSGSARRTVTLFAPSGGVVIEKQIVQGQAVAAGAPLYTMADLSRVWVDVEVREADAAALRVGTVAEVDLTAAPGRAFRGRVEFVYPVLDLTTRAVRARVSVPNLDGALKPGMFASVRLAAPARRSLAVPTSAIVNTGERYVLFMDMGGGSLMPMEVQVGRAAGDLTEILSGVDAGDRVVASAQFLLESESNLGEVMRSMMGQTGSGDMGGARDGDMKGMPGMTVPATPAPGGVPAGPSSPRRP